MTAATRAHGRHGARNRRRSLLLAEVQRLASRRFVRWLLLIAVLGYAVATPVIAWTQFARSSPALLAQAQQEVDRIVAESERFRQECLAEPLPPEAEEGTTIEDWCGPPTQAADLPAEQFLPKQPFDLAEALQPWLLAVGIGVAVLFFVIAATWIGAEWSARTMTALLFWEPRRIRVLAAKVVVLIGATAVCAAFAQAVGLGSAWLIADLRGTTGPLPDRFWPQTLAMQGRLVLLAVLVALLGFAVAQLIRSTGAALGVAFVYFAVVETLVQGLLPALAPWLLTVSVGALVTPGGASVWVPNRTVDDTGRFEDMVERTVSNLHGGLVLATVTGLLLVLGGWIFRRRDLT